MSRLRCAMVLMSDARRRVSFVAPIGAALMLAATIASDGAGERFWPQWRAPRHGRLATRNSAYRMERDEERPVEGGNPRTWLFVARRVG